MNMDEQNFPKAKNDVYPVAKIPWIPVNISSIKLEDDKLFKKIMTAGKDRDERIELYRILTRIFPFYLPKRYYIVLYSCHCSSLICYFLSWPFLKHT